MCLSRRHPASLRSKRTSPKENCSFPVSTENAQLGTGAVTNCPVWDQLTSHLREGRPGTPLPKGPGVGKLGQETLCCLL